MLISGYEVSDADVGSVECNADQKTPGCYYFLPCLVDPWIDVKVVVVEAALMMSLSASVAIGGPYFAQSHSCLVGHLSTTALKAFQRLHHNRNIARDS